MVQILFKYIASELNYKMVRFLKVPGSKSKIAEQPTQTSEFHDQNQNCCHIFFDLFKVY